MDSDSEQRKMVGIHAGSIQSGGEGSGWAATADGGRLVADQRCSIDFAAWSAV